MSKIIQTAEWDVPAMTREEAIVAVVSDILTNPEKTIRVVTAAIVAQDLLDHNHPAFDLLWEATKDERPVS